MNHSPHAARRLGLADVAATYGVEALEQRIAELRASGQLYAAIAIEREIRSGAIPNLSADPTRSRTRQPA